MESNGMKELREKVGAAVAAMAERRRQKAEEEAAEAERLRQEFMAKRREVRAKAKKDLAQQLRKKRPSYEWEASEAWAVRNGKLATRRISEARRPGLALEREEAKLAELEGDDREYDDNGVVLPGPAGERLTLRTRSVWSERRRAFVRWSWSAMDEKWLPDGVFGAERLQLRAEAKRMLPREIETRAKAMRKLGLDVKRARVDVESVEEGFETLERLEALME